MGFFGTIFGRRSREFFETWAFFVLSQMIYLLIMLRYLSEAFPLDSGLAKAYLPLALLGHSASFAILLFLSSWLLVLLRLPRKLLFWLRVLVGFVVSLLLVIDVSIYEQYRFHLNKILIDLLINGRGDVFSFTLSTWLYIWGVVTALLALQVILSWLVTRTFIQSLLRHRRIYLLYTLIMIGSILASNVIHAWADADYDRSIIRLTRHLPLYKPLTAKRFLYSKGWVESKENRDDLEFKVKAARGGQIRYPVKPLVYADPAPQPLNALLIALDCLRFDMVNEQTTPQIRRFAQRHPVQEFTRHISGGNGTRVGVFSLFYGIPGTYWDLMYQEQRGPLLMDEFIKRDYQMGIFASARLSSPPFDRTVFSGVKNLRLESEGSSAWQRDEDSLADYLQWQDQKDPAKPFFSFLFLDAIHSYDFPPDYDGGYGVQTTGLDYHALNNDTDPTPVFNRYKTSVHYIDGLVGKILDDLERRDLLKNTVVMITGDHGQEINDTGLNYWGHGSSFTRYQVQVPLLVWWPGEDAAVHPQATSHFDISTTLLQRIFGVTNDPRDFSSGQSLFNPKERDFFLSGGFSKTAVIEKDRITVSYPTGTYEIYDPENRMLPDARLRPEVMRRVFDELSRFQ